MEFGGLLLVVVTWAVSLLLAGLLVLQAPMKVDELINTTLARWPDPPRPVDPLLIRRVAWGYLTSFAWILCQILFLIPGIIALLVTRQGRYAPWLLVATFVVSFGGAALFAPQILSDMIRSSERRTIVARKVQRASSRGRIVTTIWYELLDGKTAKWTLDKSWIGHVNEGDQIEVLADPKSGTILRVISTPPA